MTTKFWTFTIVDRDMPDDEDFTCLLYRTREECEREVRNSVGVFIDEEVDELRWTPRHIGNGLLSDPSRWFQERWLLDLPDFDNIRVWMYEMKVN